MDSFNNYLNKSKADLAVTRILAQRPSLQDKADLSLKIFDQPLASTRQVIKELVPVAWKEFVLKKGYPVTGVLRQQLHPIVLDQISKLFDNIEANYDGFDVESVTLVFLVREELLMYWREFIAAKLDRFASSTSVGGPSRKSAAASATGQAKSELKTKPTPTFAWDRNATKNPLKLFQKWMRRHEVEEIIDTRRKKKLAEIRNPAAATTLTFEQPLRPPPATSVEEEVPSLSRSAAQLRGQRSIPVLSTLRRRLKAQLTLPNLRQSFYPSDDQDEAQDANVGRRNKDTGERGKEAATTESSQAVARNSLLPPQVWRVPERSIRSQEGSSPDQSQMLSSFSRDFVLPPSRTFPVVQPTRSIADIRSQMTEQGFYIPPGPRTKVIGRGNRSATATQAGRGQTLQGQSFTSSSTSSANQPRYHQQQYHQQDRISSHTITNRSNLSGSLSRSHRSRPAPILTNDEDIFPFQPLRLRGVSGNSNLNPTSPSRR